MSSDGQMRVLGIHGGFMDTPNVTGSELMNIYIDIPDTEEGGGPGCSEHLRSSGMDP